MVWHARRGVGGFQAWVRGTGSEGAYYTEAGRGYRGTQRNKMKKNGIEGERERR